MFTQLIHLVCSLSQKGLSHLVEDIQHLEEPQSENTVNNHYIEILEKSQFTAICLDNCQEPLEDTSKIQDNEEENISVVRVRKKKKSDTQIPQYKITTNNKNPTQPIKPVTKIQPNPNQPEQTTLPNPKLTLFKKHLEQKQRHLIPQKDFQRQFQPTPMQPPRQKNPSFSRKIQQLQQSNQQITKISIATIKQQNPEDLSSQVQQSHHHYLQHPTPQPQTKTKSITNHQDILQKPINAHPLNYHRQTKTQNSQHKHNISLVSNVVNYCRSQKLTTTSQPNQLSQNITSLSQLNKNNKYSVPHQKNIMRSRTRQKHIYPRLTNQKLKQIQQFLSHELEIKMQLRLVFEKKKKLQDKLKKLNYQLQQLNSHENINFHINFHELKKQNINKKQKYIRIYDIVRNNKSQHEQFYQYSNSLHSKNNKGDLSNRKKTQQLIQNIEKESSNKKIRKNQSNRKSKCQCLDFNRLNIKLNSLIGK